MVNVWISKIDVDGSGFLEMKELETIMLRISADMGVEPPKQQDIEEVFKSLDKDNNGTIDYNEFALLIKNILLSLIKNEEGDEHEEDIDI